MGTCLKRSEPQHLTAQSQFGLGLKFLQSQIASYKGEGFAADLGAMYHMIAVPFSFGLAVRNLGPGIAFSQEKTALPLTLSLGAASYFIPGMALAADVRYRPYDQKMSFNVGTEYMAWGPMVLRAGYQTLQSEILSGRSSIFSGLGGGFGLKLFKYQLDYALTPFGELGNIQRLSLSARW